MNSRLLPARVELQTPAKVNLFLEILGKRPDGYHEIETLLAAISLGDTLVLTSRSDGEIGVDCQWASGLNPRPSGMPKPASADNSPLGDLPPPEKNIVWRAIHLLQQRSATGLGAEIRLVKRIPSAAGLGGASSNAAAALVAANQAWRLNWSREQLGELAAELGSDVPFFLRGGLAMARGRGEHLQPIAFRRLNLVVVRPPVGLSTPAVYKACQPTREPQSSVALQEALRRGNPCEIGRHLYNGLESPAASLTPWIRRLAREFAQVGTCGHIMSGSGSSYFGLFGSARQARRAASVLRGRNVGRVFQGFTMN